MHPLIQEQIRTIDLHLTDLRESIAARQAALEKQRAEHEELQREQWRHRRQQVTIGHMTEDLSNVQRRLELYAAERTAIHESLDSALNALKGLRSALTG